MEKSAGLTKVLLKVSVCEAPRTPARRLKSAWSLTWLTWLTYGDSMGIQPFKLVGGIPTPLKNDGLMEWVSNSWDDDSHYCIWKVIIQSCSKPPSRESQWGMFFGVIGSREKKSTEMFSLLVIWAKHNDRKQDLLGGWPGWPMGILLGFYRNSIGIL